MRAAKVLAAFMVLVGTTSAQAQYYHRDREFGPVHRFVPPFERRSLPAREGLREPIEPRRQAPNPARTAHATDGQVCDNVDKDPDAAIEACGRIVARGQLKNGYSLAVAYIHRGQAYENKGDHEHAIGDFSDAIRLRPAVAGYFIMRAAAAEKSGNVDAARGDFRKAASLDPKNPDALNGLKRIETRSAASVAPQVVAASVPPPTQAASPPSASTAPPAATPVASVSPPAAHVEPSPAASTAHGARVALVIGNGKYVNANVLPNPPNDAHAIAGALREIGFDVQEGNNLDRAAMETQFREFLRKASTASVVLLFYAGHGMQVDGKNYLVPVDAKLAEPSDLPFETIEIDKVLDPLGDPGHTNIILLDACRDNPLARSFALRLPATRSAAVPAGLAAYSAVGTGTLIAYATAPGQTALDGQGSNSPFTASLLHNLTTPGLEIRQVLTRVRAEVAKETNNRQIPWDNSSLMGDVVLVAQKP